MFPSFWRALPPQWVPQGLPFLFFESRTSRDLLLFSFKFFRPIDRSPPFLVSRRNWFSTRFSVGLRLPICPSCDFFGPVHFLFRPVSLVLGALVSSDRARCRLVDLSLALRFAFPIFFRNNVRTSACSRFEDLRTGFCPLRLRLFFSLSPTGNFPNGPILFSSLFYFVFRYPLFLYRSLRIRSNKRLAVLILARFTEIRPTPFSPDLPPSPVQPRLVPGTNPVLPFPFVFSEVKFYAPPLASDYNQKVYYWRRLSFCSALSPNRFFWRVHGDVVPHPPPLSARVSVHHSNLIGVSSLETPFFFLYV